mmetsp:Transcript_45093/g.75942  ORF Transcript_45093/g.75942 Transcript_45093/m.75942 type:complete len:399 (-) Transcript_45093:354-1550(-)
MSSWGSGFSGWRLTTFRGPHWSVIRGAVHLTLEQVTRLVTGLNAVEHRTERFARHKAAPALLALELSVLPGHLPSGDGHRCDTLDLHALEDVVVHFVVVGLGGDGALGGTIPDHNICVRAHVDAALLRVAVKDLGGVGAGNRHKLTRGQFASHDAVVPNDTHAILNAVHAVRDLREVIFSHCLLVRVESAIVSAHHLQVTCRQHVHEVMLHSWIWSQRRAHHVCGRVTPAPAKELCAISAKPRCNGLPIHPLPGLAPQTHHLTGAPGHHVHDVHGGVHAVGDHNGTVRGLSLHIFGSRELLTFWACDTNFQASLLPDGDHFPILRVDLGDSTHLFASGEGIVQLFVVEHEDVFVRHEHFERVGATLACNDAHFLLNLLTPPSDGHMEAVIAVHLGVCP